MPRRVYKLAILGAFVVLTGAGGPAPASERLKSSEGAAGSPMAGKDTPKAPDVKLARVTFADLAGWQTDNHVAALRAFCRSCARVLAAVRGGNAASRVPTPPALLSACADAEAIGARANAAEARHFFETHFVPHRVAHKDKHGLLTGYYEPLLEGSRLPDERFKTPVFRRPPDLVNLVEESQRGALGAGLTHARQTARGFEPFPTRAAIEKGALAGKGLELIYLADPVDVFFMQVQGSGRIKLTDGSLIRVSYDGKNGHPYTSIGRYLIDTGILAADKMSLGALSRWLKTDLARAQDVMWQNASYVFFRELKGEQAKGALGVLDIPLTPGRSLAVDAGFHAIGLPVYVDAPALTHATPGKAAFRRLMVAQDVGSAIKGPERGDIYFGSGKAAGQLAGITKHPGNFFVLMPEAIPARPVASSNPKPKQAQR